MSDKNTNASTVKRKLILTRKETVLTTAAPQLQFSNLSQNLSSGKLGRFRNDPVSFIIKLSQETTAFYSGTDWRAYEEYIGAKILYPEYTNQIRKQILSSKLVRGTIEEALKPFQNDRKEYQKNKYLMWKLANENVNGMIAEVDSISTLRGFAFVINNMMVRMYHQGIHIAEAEFLKLKKVAEEAQRNNISLIFLPCHKSHIDYLVISYIFYRLGLAVPHIAAGENLNMPVVGKVLKKCGAFFIRRQWGDDKLYLAIMKVYIELLLERGHNIEAFIEGTRSRMGKLLQPKFGILKLILQAVLDGGKVKDCIIVPMSVGYDKVIESSAYVNELLGTPKEKESLFQLISNFNILSLKWGRIDVRFAEPFSLKSYVESQKERRGAEFNPKSSIPDRDLLLQSLGFRILGDINEASVIMPTSLVGTVLLTLRGRGVGRDELIRKVNWLTAEIMKKGGRVADFAGMSTGEIVDRAINVLKELISVRGDLLEPVFHSNKRFELSLYRNQVIHLFINETIISTALYATIKAGGPISQQKVKKEDLTKDVRFLSSLLKQEFIFQMGGLKDNISKSLDDMIQADILIVEVDPGLPGQGFVETKKQFVSLSMEERRIGREHFETYWLTAVSLFSLVQDHHQIKKAVLDASSWVDERKLLQRIQFFGKSLYYEGDLSYFESVNIETIKNAINRLRDMGIIIHHKAPLPPIHQTIKALKPPPSTTKDQDIKLDVHWLALHPGWLPEESLPSVPRPRTWNETNSNGRSSENGGHGGGGEKDMVKEEGNGDDTEYLDSWYDVQPRGKLWDFCERIGSFRREGKNRRDTSTVAIRVLRLARMSSHWTFDGAGKKKPTPNLASNIALSGSTTKPSVPKESKLKSKI